MLALAGGAGSRWTQGAGVVKALHPFCRFHGKYRNFIEVHLAKSRRVGRQFRRRRAARRLHQLPDPRADRSGPCATQRNYGYPRAAAALAGPLGRPADGAHAPRPALRLGGDAAADPRRAGPEGPREPARLADRLGRERPAAAATTPTTCRCSACTRPGHWFEVPNLLRNGTLARLLGRAAATEVPDAAQHRHAGRRPRPGPAGPAHPPRGLPDATRSSRGGSRTAAAGWPASTAACGWSRAWPCPARKTSSA